MYRNGGELMSTHVKAIRDLRNNYSEISRIIKKMVIQLAHGR